MSIYNNIPYTYRIKWSSTGVSYYGVRYAKNCNPKEFWITYFTSSQYVADYVKQHGDPDIKEIRKTFNSITKITEAQEWEHRVLKRLKVIKRTDWLNKTDNKAFYSTDPEVENKRKTNLKKALNTDETKELLRIAVTNSWTDSQIRERRICSQNKESVRESKRKANSLRIGINASHVDKTIYTFIHDNGTIESCIRSDLVKKYQLSDGNLSTIINGTSNRKKHKGWSISNLPKV